VLVSGETFSGGEGLAFDLQEAGRATVVGEPTRGGAHPRIGLAVHPQLELTLPIARSRGARSGGNWEGTGVQPDVRVPAAEALDAALAHLGTVLAG
jgi:C-terminal processing protease CtpA/Prc